MDTSDHPPLPSLGQINARLAVNGQRVGEIVDSQLDFVERLFSAVIVEDWPAVAAASRRLAELNPDQVGTEVIREARHVFEELSHTPIKAAEVKQPKHLANLLAACRLAKLRPESS